MHVCMHVCVCVSVCVVGIWEFTLSALSIQGHLVVHLRSYPAARAGDYAIPTECQRRCSAVWGCQTRYSRGSVCLSVCLTMSFYLSSSVCLSVQLYVFPPVKQCHVGVQFKCLTFPSWFWSVEDHCCHFVCIQLKLSIVQLLMSINPSALEIVRAESLSVWSEGSAEMRNINKQ